jgi:hypothetical protein
MTEDIEKRIKYLEARVQELSDKEAVRELRYRYHECFNEARYDGIPDLFAEDAEIDFGNLGRGKGKNYITKFFTVEIPQLSSFYKQFIHNHVVWFEGDKGKGFSYLEAKPIHKGESYLVCAKYDDEYVKVDGQWKFQKMFVTIYFTVPFREGWAQEDRIKMKK